MRAGCARWVVVGEWRAWRRKGEVVEYWRWLNGGRRGSWNER